MKYQYQELFCRHESNPILTSKDWPYPAHSVFNPAATLLPDGTTLLLCRVEDRRGQSHLCAARSANGIDGSGKLTINLLLALTLKTSRKNFGELKTLE